MAKYKEVEKDGQLLSLVAEGYYGYNIYVGERNFVYRYYQIRDVNDEIIYEEQKNISVGTEAIVEKFAKPYVQANLIKKNKGFNNFIGYEIKYTKMAKGDAVIKAGIFEIDITNVNSIPYFYIRTLKPCYLRLFVDGEEMKNLGFGILAKGSRLEYNGGPDKFITGKIIKIIFKDVPTGFHVPPNPITILRK